MEFADPEDSIYSALDSPDGMQLIPSEFAGGPWNPDHQHGGAISGILARALVQIESAVPMRLTRMTAEMFRGVPLKPLRTETEIIRDGRRIQSAEVRLFSEDVLVARATGLRIRSDDSNSELKTREARDPELGAPPESPVPLRRNFDLPVMPGFIRAVEIQSEPPIECGVPANFWTRLRCEFMAGERTDPIVRLASLVDFASGTGNAMDYSKYTSINPDLSVHILRAPRSDWIGMRGTTWRTDDSIGHSQARIYDLEGVIGSVSASLLLSPR